MKKKLLIIGCIFLFIIAVVIGAIYLIQKSKIPQNKKNEKYIVKDVEDFSLDEYLVNDKTIITFFASWCSHCIEESEQLNKFIIENPNINILVISHDQTKDDLIDYLDEKGYNWQVIFDKNKTIRHLIDPGKSGIPCTYIIDNKKNILAFNEGKLTCDQLKKLYKDLHI